MSHSLKGIPTVREARLYERSGEGVRCRLCCHSCFVPPGGRGFCKTRMNTEGKLYTLTYGDIVACESRPMEIKPFFHFHPGKSAITFSGPSCNLRCQWCQNHHLSRQSPRPLKARCTEPREIVEAALAFGDIGTCASFTEPTLLFEYCLDLFPLAREKGVVNTIVSNGYMSEEALRLLAQAGLDAINVDVKGSDEVYKTYCRARKGSSPPWENIRLSKSLGIHVEVVHLVVTGLNDDIYSFQEICEKHLEFAGPEVPLHITAYYPAYRYIREPTSLGFMEKAWEVAKAAGVLYPYLGNVRAPAYENTYCHNCGKLLIHRSGCAVEGVHFSGSSCSGCGAKLYVKN